MTPLRLRSLLAAGALAAGAAAACSQGSASADSTSPTEAIAANDAPASVDADMKEVILNVFGMT